MRPLAITALVLLSVLAVAPHASADPACTTDLCGDPNDPPSCMEKTVGPVTTHEDCTREVKVPLMSCPIAGSWKHVHLGPVVVSYYTCD